MKKQHVSKGRLTKKINTKETFKVIDIVVKETYHLPRHTDEFNTS